MFEGIFHCLLAYLSGSVLYALLLRMPFGIDPCKTGVDGNPGAANAFRAGGIVLGIPGFTP